MAAIDLHDIQGLILAGGKSSRFNTNQKNIDKGLLSFNGKPFVQHTLDFMRAAGVTDIYVSANQNIAKYKQYADVLPDLASIEYAGPLAGIYTALSHTDKNWLWVLPVDMLCLPNDLLQRLLTCATKKQPSYVTNDNDSHPLCLLMHTSMQEELLAYLKKGERKVQQWLALNQAQTVAFAGNNFFKNINNRFDLESLLQS